MLFARSVSWFPCSRHSTHPGRLTTKHILPQDPVCLGSTCDRGSGVEDGVTTLSVISSAVSKALDSTACAASILAERIIRDDDGIAMLISLSSSYTILIFTTTVEHCEWSFNLRYESEFESGNKLNVRYCFTNMYQYNSFVILRSIDIKYIVLLRILEAPWNGYLNKTAVSKTQKKEEVESFILEVHSQSSPHTSYVVNYYNSLYYVDKVINIIYYSETPTSIFVTSTVSYIKIFILYHHNKTCLL